MLSMPNTTAKQPKAHMNSITLPSEAKQPMLHAACDLFSAVEKQWLALVNRFSGYAWTMALKRLDTKAVIQHLESWFNDFGWPTHIRTDGGLQFRSEFKQFCAAHGIEHELSSPYNPKSEKSQKHRLTLHGEGGKHPARHSCVEKYEPTGRKLSSTAILWKKTETRLTPTAATLGRKPPAVH